MEIYMNNKTYIAVALGSCNTLEARRLWTECAVDADIVELRLDLMEEYDLTELLRNRPCPVIVTNRPVREGGRYEGDETERIKVLLKAAELGAEHIDCEADSYQLIKGLELGECKIILSRHNFDGMYADMQHEYKGLYNQGSDIAKLVCTAEKMTDSVAAINVMRHATSPVISIAMGHDGAISRILAAKYGAYLTFAAPNNIEGTAPGQLTINMMKKTYMTDEIDCDTQVYGYISDDEISEQKLDKLNNGLRSSGKNAVVVPMQTGNETPGEIVHAYRELDFASYVVESSRIAGIAEECDELDSGVNQKDKINSIVAIDGCLTGFVLSDLELDTLIDFWTE